MSRIGKSPVAVPQGVEVKIDGQHITAKGKLGQLQLTLVPEVAASLEDGQITVSPVADTRKHRMMWGMSRTLVSNLVTGVGEGFTVALDISGVGYRAQMQGKDLVLSLGFSHEVRYPAPEGIEIKAPQQTRVEISGADKQRVGQVAAEIRSYRPPEPYKGKGVRYAGEQILRKEGKKK